MAHRLPNFSSIAARRLVVIESNSRVFQSVQEALDSAYALHHIEQECGLSTDFAATELPGVTVLDWDATERSVSVLEQVLAAHSGSPVLLLLTATDERELGKSGSQPVAHFEPLSLVAQVEQIAAQNPAPAMRVAEPQQPISNSRETVLRDGSAFVRTSKRMRELEAQASLVAKSDIPLLILGESGTGKEVLSKYIHTVSDRSDEMFLKVNCAAMPADLLESELFGYEQGAFTGAVKSKPGKFEICDGGTIFLDEIGEMPAVLQAKLLHVLQDGTYSRLGSRTPMQANVRVIAATNVDMKTSIANKSFREDLYYRLNGFTLTLPPLRERREEIATFAQHFMEKGARRFGREPLPISAHLLAALSSYEWPGNLREMENVINRYLVIGDEQAIMSELMTHQVARTDEHGAGDSATVGLKQLARSVKGNAEAIAIAAMLEETGWNRKKAAARMQVSYKTLLYKIRQYGLAPEAN